MNTPPPQSIPADKFKPRFDTTTTAGKIAVMQEAERVGYVYMKGNFDEWCFRENPAFDSLLKYYNFPAEPKRTLVPWNEEEVPVGAILRHKGKKLSIKYLIVCNQECGLTGYNANWSFEYLASDMEHSLDNGRTWLPCGTWKEEEEV